RGTAPRPRTPRCGCTWRAPPPPRGPTRPTGRGGTSGGGHPSPPSARGGRAARFGGSLLRRRQTRQQALLRFGPSALIDQVKDARIERSPPVRTHLSGIRPTSGPPQLRTDLLHDLHEQTVPVRAEPDEAVEPVVEHLGQPPRRGGRRS